MTPFELELGQRLLELGRRLGVHDAGVLSSLLAREGRVRVTLEGGYAHSLLSCRAQETQIARHRSKRVLERQGWRLLERLGSDEGMQWLLFVPVMSQRASR
jgi:hypothetical protein